MAVGRLKAGAERDLANQYVARALQVGRGVGLSRLIVDEIDESRARRPEDRRSDEARALQAVLADRRIVVLDERGHDMTSERFARAISDGDGRTTAFVIGGADGLAPDLIARADDRLRFGAMTLPHGLVRVLLAEQIYRAMTILAGHPYHRSSTHRDQP